MEKVTAKPYLHNLKTKLENRTMQRQTHYPFDCPLCATAVHDANEFLWHLTLNAGHNLPLDEAMQIVTLYAPEKEEGVKRGRGK